MLASGPNLSQHELSAMSADIFCNKYIRKVVLNKILVQGSVEDLKSKVISDFKRLLSEEM